MMETFECVSCLGTYTGDWADIQRLGWTRHQYGHMVKADSVLVCGECNASLANRRKLKAQCNAIMAATPET